MSEITISHSHEDGTILEGSSEGDGVWEILRGLRDNWWFLEKALAVERTGEPATQAGCALFAADGEVALDPPLPAPPAVPSTSWGLVPRLTPLLEAVGDDPVCLVVTVDKSGADFALHSSRGGEDAGTVAGVDWPTHRTGRNDRAERHLQSKAEESWEHNAREIAEAAREVFEKSGAAALLLAGDPRERKSVHEKLPPLLRDVTYETAHGGRAPGADTASLDRDIAQVRALSERAHLAEVTGRFRARAEPAGGETPYAAEGIPALIEAAREHQIDTLLVSPHSADAARNVWVGKTPDQVAVRSSRTPVPGRAPSHPGTRGRRPGPLRRGQRRRRRGGERSRRSTGRGTGRHSAVDGGGTADVRRHRAVGVPGRSTRGSDRCGAVPE
ncbi:baeRF2 domain-containing protein [Streptomyces halobius]|uniref:Universal stress protein family protein n=1 Tax=Streptomyces halobius TaxID=2879846 RepID=A0ABY4M146_9ACTN|nr:Vms1/Ankzf1 family peptidyl-tRNA hydrolase [Streptomyces halobius]UQA91467.1 hypothetical protein K9S39_05870 [Streptomyces halobius]